MCLGRLVFCWNFQLNASLVSYADFKRIRYKAVVIQLKILIGKREMLQETPDDRQRRDNDLWMKQH